MAALDSRALADLKVVRLQETRKNAQTDLSLNSNSAQTALLLAFIERDLGEESGREQLQYFAKAFPGLFAKMRAMGSKSEHTLFR